MTTTTSQIELQDLVEEPQPTSKSASALLLPVVFLLAPGACVDAAGAFEEGLLAAAAGRPEPLVAGEVPRLVWMATVVSLSFGSIGGASGMLLIDSRSASDRSSICSSHTHATPVSPMDSFKMGHEIAQ